MTLKLTNALLLVTILLGTSCSNKMKKNDSNDSEYNQVPREELLQNTPLAQSVYGQLKQQYTDHVLKLKSAAEANGSKFLMLYLTPECGNSLTAAQRRGKEYIESFMTTNQILCKDLTSVVENRLELTLMPKDGHWSKTGAQVIATELNAWLRTFQGYQATPNASLQPKPAVFGDLEPNQDIILDGGKDLPYRMITNAQGLRSTSNISFPKKKQRIILLGDSELFCPFLDNQDGIAEQLQAIYPEAEIVNTANWGYSVDDYLSLYREKVQYLEGDIVVMATNGNDIIDLFFTNRKMLGRKKQGFPSEEEKAFYHSIFK